MEDSMAEPPNGGQRKGDNLSVPVWWSFLCDAIKLGDVEETKKLLQLNQCKLKDAVHSIEKVALLKPLHLAVTQGNIDLVDFLISSGFSIQSTNLYGETPLHIACRQGHAEIVQYLIAAGANIDSKDCGECTSLFHAINGKKPEVVKLLIQAGCDLDALNEELMSPMDQAVYYNQSDIIALLLKGGCSIYKTMGYVYYPGHFSNSLLFSLWANGDIDNVCLLLEAGYVISYSQFEKMLQVSHILNFDEKILNVLSQLLHQPLSLQSVCRVVIRRHLMEKQSNTRTALDSFIKRLPLPEKLIDFLSIR
ncbi:hypothetical protein CHS0354_027841 [Potamilus streckersoni]|uniref:SOCS box domain-containing protein n=1 Tax=Potamilus streckersoni TaxID=2493646 RepID=A0AAE0T1C2_9BIVA|nr:hypothetical protein CHS0354_027841 [Potamilus streckersoni]